MINLQKNNYVEDVSGVLVKDFNSVQHTPAEYGKINDEDEEDNPGVGCRQM